MAEVVEALAALGATRTAPGFGAKPCASANARAVGESAAATCGHVSGEATRIGRAPATAVMSRSGCSIGLQTGPVAALAVASARRVGIDDDRSADHRRVERMQGRRSRIWRKPPLSRGCYGLVMPTLALVLLVAAVALLLLWTVLLRRDALVGRRTRAAASANLARRMKRW